MIINGAWYVDNLPETLVIERTNGELGTVQIAPFRIINAEEIQPYSGHHPRKVKGLPLHNYLYEFFGLEKSREGYTEYISVRCTPSEKTRFASWANSNNLSETEAMRAYIRNAPDGKYGA